MSVETEEEVKKGYYLAVRANLLFHSSSFSDSPSLAVPTPSCRGGCSLSAFVSDSSAEPSSLAHLPLSPGISLFSAVNRGDAFRW